MFCSLHLRCEREARWFVLIGYWPDGCVGAWVVLLWSFVPSYGKGWDWLEPVDGSFSFAMS